MNQVVTDKKMSDELIKSIIASASARSLGLTIRVTCICGNITDSSARIKNTSPGVVCQKDDGRVGFHTDGVSYITSDEKSANLFYVWLEKANSLAAKGEEYDQPSEGCTFHRCC